MLGLAGFRLVAAVRALAEPAPLLAGRLPQGACGALMTPQTLQVIQRRFEGLTGAKAVGLYSLVLALGVWPGSWPAAWS